MKAKHLKKSESAKALAMEHITALFGQAEIRFSEDPRLSHKHIKMAKEIAMHYKIRLPNEMKRMVCKHCHHYMVPGKNCRVRTQHGKVVYSCLDCRGFMRFPYLREQKAKKRGNSA